MPDITFQKKMNTDDRMKPNLKSQNPANIVQSTSYALPCIPVVMLFAPSLAIIQGIYAKHYGIALTTLAAIILLSRLLDAVSDPIIGYYSDRYRLKHGTRKPFVVVGGLMILLCGYFLYIPPVEVTALYAGFWLIAFFTAYTVFEIPHLTWPSDIASESGDTVKLYSFRVFAQYCGLIFFYSIPLLPFFESKAITPETQKVTFIVAAVLTIPFLFQAIRVVPNGNPPLVVNDSGHFLSWNLLRSTSREIVTNKPFLLFLLAFLFSGFAIGMWYGLIYIYVDAYLGMGDQFAQLFLIAFIIGIMVTPLWYKLTLKFGKKNIWISAVTLMIFSFIFTGTLEPGETTFAQLLALKIIQTCGFVCIYVVTPAMLSEIIDYSHWKTGVEKNATYFSLKVFFEKANMAAGAALGLAVAGWYGFDVVASEQTRESIVGLTAAIVWIPTVMGMISLIFIALSPIDERRHRSIRRRLDARLARAEALTAASENESLNLKDSLGKQYVSEIRT